MELCMRIEKPGSPLFCVGVVVHVEILGAAVHIQDQRLGCHLVHHLERAIDKAGASTLMRGGYILL